MRFGVFTSLTGPAGPGVLELWQHLESTGWDIACVSDHFMPNTPQRQGPVLESWSTLSALAAVVPRMQIGTCLAGTPDQIREQLNELRAVGATEVFIPTIFRPLDAPAGLGPIHR